MKGGPNHLPVAPFVILDKYLECLPPNYEELEDQLESVWRRENGVALAFQLAPTLKDMLDPARSNVRRSTPVRKLKTLVRGGIPVTMRAELYPLFAQVKEYADHSRDFRSGLERVFGPNVPTEPLIPQYGGDLDQDWFPFAEGGHQNVSFLLCIFANDHPDIDFCPFVPSLASLLSIYMPNSDVLGCLASLVTQSGVRNMWCYLPVGQKDYQLFVYVFCLLVKNRLPNFMKHLARHNLLLQDWRQFWMSVIGGVFTKLFSIAQVMRIVDALFLEGSKIFIRVGLGLLSHFEKRLLTCTTFDEMEKALIDACSPRDFDIGAVFNAGFRFTISRQEVMRTRFRLLSRVALELQPVKAYLRPLPELSQQSIIMDADMLQTLWSWMPQQYRIRNLELLFCTQQHGYSLNTFYAMNADVEPTLMLVKTTTGEVFGAFLTDTWQKRRPRRFFGSGESFVFTLKPEPAVYYWARVEGIFDGQIRFRSDTYREVPTNFQQGEQGFIAIGGGETGAALWIDKELRKCHSSPSPTFENLPLTGKAEVIFECSIIELFGVV